MSELYSVAILAGGLATRIRPLTAQTPKALLLLNGKPFLFHQLKLLREQNIRRVILCVGFLGEQIQAYAGDGSGFGIQIDYCFDGPTLLGTAGALKRALPWLGESFFVLNGDSYLPCDFTNVQTAYQQQGKPALMTVFRNQDQWDKSNIEYRDGKIIEYNKAHPNAKMHYIDYGLSIFNRSVFDSIPADQPYDLALLNQTLISHQLMSAYEVSQRFYEIGSFTGLTELDTHLAGSKIC